MTQNSDNSSANERLQTIRLSVPEMDCPSCAGKVDKSLQRLDGVIETELQPTTGTATVTYDAETVSGDTVVAAVESAGYEVLTDGSESDADASGVDVAPPSETWTSPRAIKTWIGAVSVTLGLLVEFGLTGQNIAVASVLAYPLTLADVLFLGAVAVSGAPVVRSGYYSAKTLILPAISSYSYSPPRGGELRQFGTATSSSWLARNHTYGKST